MLNGLLVLVYLLGSSRVIPSLSYTIIVIPEARVLSALITRIFRTAVSCAAIAGTSIAGASTMASAAITIMAMIQTLP